MASDSELLTLGETDPARTYRLSQFIKVGSQAPTLSYTDFSYRETHKGISYVIKNVINDYLPELKKLARKVLLSDKEYEKYKYKPKILSYDLYGTTEYYIYLLMINDMCNIYEFDSKKLLIITKSTLNLALNSIYRSEQANIIEFNNSHT